MAHFSPEGYKTPSTETELNDLGKGGFWETAGLNQDARFRQLDASLTGASTDATKALQTANAYASQIAQANTTAGSAVAIANDAKDTVETIEGPISTRLGALEVIGGLEPGDVSDATVQNLITQEGTGTRAALNAQIAYAGMVATRHGLTGDNTTDDGAAFQTLLNTAATLGAPVILNPGSRFRIGRRIQVPSGTRLLMDGATLVNTMTASLNDALLHIDGKSDVLVEGGAVDGDRANKPVLSEWQHGVIILGNSKNFTIRRVRSYNNNGDGVYINGTATACPENITLDHIVADNNVRQSLSITGVRGFTDYSSIYSNSNGKPPEAGVDLEPNTGTSPMEALVFNGSIIFGNTGSGIDVAAWRDRTIRQGDVEFIGVTVRNNARGVRLVAGDGIRFTGGSIRENTEHGVWSSSSAGYCTDVSFTGTQITGNGGASIRTDMGIRGRGLTLINCDLRGNTTRTPGVGVDILPLTPMDALTLIGNRMGGASQTHALRTNSNVKNVTRLGNTYEPQGSALSIGDEAASRYVAEHLLTATPFDEFLVQATTPPAPSSGAARVFSRKNTNGKAELCVLFNSGDPQVIATQP